MSSIPTSILFFLLPYGSFYYKFFEESTKKHPDWTTFYSLMGVSKDLADKVREAVAPTYAVTFYSLMGVS